MSDILWDWISELTTVSQFEALEPIIDDSFAFEALDFRFDECFAFLKHLISDLTNFLHV